MLQLKIHKHATLLSRRKRASYNHFEIFKAMSLARGSPQELKKWRGCDQTETGSCFARPLWEAKLYTTACNDDNLFRSGQSRFRRLNAVKSRAQTNRCWVILNLYLVCIVKVARLRYQPRQEAFSGEIPNMRATTWAPCPFRSPAHCII